MAAFRLQLEPEEYTYLLFKRKKCPRCGGAMTKHLRNEVVNGSKFTARTEETYVKGSNKVNNYFYFFTCNRCNSEFTLNELTRR